MIMDNAPMKRIAIAVLLVAPIALSGCQTIRSHNPFRHREPPYKSAQQERPLEVPPGMTEPPTTDALTIPGADTGTAPPTSGAAGENIAPPAIAPAEASAEGAAAATVSKTLTLSDIPDSAFHRVGLALQRGDAGKVTPHDDTLTYQVAVETVVTQKPTGGALRRLFHRSRRETVQDTVTITIAAHGTGSVVEASGSADAVARVMDLLQQRLQ